MDPSLIAKIGSFGSGVGRFAGAIGPGISQIAGGVSANRQAGINADRLRQAGVIAADDVRRGGRRVAGQQIAAFAANSVSSTSGDALNILAETAAEVELSALREQFGFDDRAYAEEVEGRAALISGSIKGTGSIITKLQEEYYTPEKKDFEYVAPVSWPSPGDPSYLPEGFSVRKPRGYGGVKLPNPNWRAPLGSAGSAG